MSAPHGLAAADETRVVFVTHGQSGDPYWSVVKNGMDDAAKTLGVKAEYLSPETFDMAKMAQMIDAVVASKPDGLVVSIPDAAALSATGEERGCRRHTGHRHQLRRLEADQGARRPAVHGAGSNIQAGVMAGERIKALGVTKAVCANHEVGNSSLDDRCAGFAKGLGVDVPVMNGVIDPTEMKNRVIAYMTAHADTQFILAVGASGAEPTLAALDELGLAGKVKTGTFDLSPTILQAIVDGKMEWGIDAQQYAMGYIPVVDVRPVEEVQDHADRRLSDRSRLRHQGHGGLGDRPGEAGQALSCKRRPGLGPAACLTDRRHDMASEVRDERVRKRSLPEPAAEPAGARRGRRNGAGLRVLRHRRRRQRPVQCQGHHQLPRGLGPARHSRRAVALLMIAGEFDLSVGSMIGFAGILIAIPAVLLGLAGLASLLFAFAVCGGVGVLNGLAVVQDRPAVLHRHARQPVHAARPDARGSRRLSPGGPRSRASTSWPPAIADACFSGQFCQA